MSSIYIDIFSVGQLHADTTGLSGLPILWISGKRWEQLHLGFWAKTIDKVLPKIVLPRRYVFWSHSLIESAIKQKFSNSLMSTTYSPQFTSITISDHKLIPCQGSSPGGYSVPWSSCIFPQVRASSVLRSSIYSGSFTVSSTVNCKRNNTDAASAFLGKLSGQPDSIKNSKSVIKVQVGCND